MTKLELLKRKRMTLATKLDNTSLTNFMLVAVELQNVMYEIYLIESKAEQNGC